MGFKRSKIQKVGPGATGASTTFALGVPSWAQAVVLHVKATTAAASTLDGGIYIDAADGEGTEIAIVTFDQIPASQTDAQRYVACGLGVGALAGTSIDAVAFPLPRDAQLKLTVVGTVTDVDVYAEFQG